MSKRQVERGRDVMALKRKPPAGNVRRVAPIGNNLRYAITSKANETVQCESFQERKLTLLFDRDPTIREYRSQPMQFTFTDAQKKTVRAKNAGERQQPSVPPMSGDRPGVCGGNESA